MRCLWCASLAGLVAVAVNAAAPAEPQGDNKDLELKVVAKNSKVAWDGGGMAPAEYRKMLDKVAEDLKDKKGGFRVKAPPPPNLDLALVITNKSKEDVTIYLGGDPNQYTFELKGPGVMALPNNVAMTADFKLPKAVTLKAGGTYEMLLTKLSDGMRGMTRHVYWTEPGEYTLAVSYQLSDQQGKKTQLLKSEPIKITVEMPK
jgi:hypothetical protein